MSELVSLQVHRHSVSLNTEWAPTLNKTAMQKETGKSRVTRTYFYDNVGRVTDLVMNGSVLRCRGRVRERGLLFGEGNTQQGSQWLLMVG